MIVVGGPIIAQQPLQQKGNLLLNLKPKFYSLSSIGVGKQIISPTFNSLLISGDHYSKQLGFFCRQEIKMDKALKIPFRFRLGSVEQCDWLEGKKR